MDSLDGAPQHHKRKFGCSRLNLLASILEIHSWFRTFSFGQSGGASWSRVCYQRGLHRLFSSCSSFIFPSCFCIFSYFLVPGGFFYPPALTGQCIQRQTGVSVPYAVRQVHPSEAAQETQEEVQGES